jgi:glycosyltransferase involved in cell wall biosynthesis
MPLVSVLIPVRDAEATLGSCLRSVQRQRLTGWECIVVDDGSRDRSGAIAAAAAAEDPRIQVVQAPARGIVVALNDGLSRCRGEFIARHDADDLMHRDRLAAQCDALRRDDRLAAVGCHVRLFPRRLLSSGRRAYECWLNGLASDADVQRDAFVECPVAHPALMVRRTILQALAYRDVQWAEDYDLVLRLLQHVAPIGMVPRRLVAWRDSEGRLSRTDARYAIDRFTDCKAHFLARGFLARDETFVLWGYGDTGRMLARALVAEGKRLECIIEVHPRRLGQRIAGVPVVGLDALAALRGTRIVVSVAGAAPRQEIRTHLSARGFTELEDFVCAA